MPTGQLNKFVQKILAENPLPLRSGARGQSARAAYMTQVATKPPAFAFFVGHPKDVSDNYLRYLENQLREKYGFIGCPIRILVRQK